YIVFQFNAMYAQRFALLAGTRTALLAGFDFLTPSGLPVLSGIGFAVGVSCLLAAREKIPAALRPLLGICALALPLEIALVTTTRRDFDHYFVALLYVLAVWAAWMLQLVREGFYAALRAVEARTSAIVTGGLVCGIGVLLLPLAYKDYLIARG